MVTSTAAPCDPEPCDREPCDRIAELMPDLLDDPWLLCEADSDHVAQCLTCQAEKARYRKLRRTLASLASTSATVDTELLDRILERLDSVSERRDRHRAAGLRAASIVGLAAATAAGVGGVLVLATRRRSA